MRTRLKTGTIRRARHLRDEATEPERVLWARLRELNRHGFHFRRQVPFRGYFLDFADHSARLAVELDGGQHGSDEQMARDAVRDRVLAEHGYQVLRIPNSELVRDIDQVIRVIVHELEARSPPPDRLRRSTSPRGGG